MKFLKNTTLLFFWLILMFLYSCSDKQTPSPNQPINAGNCRLESSRHISNAFPDSVKYTYNNSGQLTQVDYFEPVSGDPRGSTLLKYDADGRVIQKLNAAGTVNDNFQYGANGLLLTVSDANQFIRQEYEYNSSGHLVKVKKFSSLSGVRTLTAFNIITPDAEGQIWKDSTFWVNTDGTTSFSSVDEYLYDDKIGIGQYLPPLGPDVIRYSFQPQKHNVISTKLTTSFGDIVSFTYELDYNAQQFPVKAKYFRNGIYQDSYRFHYSCR